MKRQSKAEEALNGQLRAVKAQIDDVYIAWQEQKVKLTVLNEIKIRLEDEIDRLKQARVHASEQQKKGAPPR